MSRMLLREGDAVWWNYSADQRASTMRRIPALVEKVTDKRVTIVFERIERGEKIIERKSVAHERIALR